jgi:hypothetical protein
VTRVDVEELVTAAEIGRRFGVTRQRAQQLAQQPGFPDPLGRLGNYVIYRWRDVEAWGRKNRPAQPANAPSS